jgi:hypothetical protein
MKIEVEKGFCIFHPMKRLMNASLKLRRRGRDFL